MLVQYTSQYEKVVMSLLSYRSELDSYKKINLEINHYLNNHHDLLLWKPDSISDVQAVIPMYVDDNFVYIQYICMSPDYRSGKNIQKILEDISQLYEKRRIMTSPELSKMFNSWKFEKRYSN